MMLEDEQFSYPSSPPLSPVTTARSVSVYPPLDSPEYNPSISPGSGRNGFASDHRSSTSVRKRTQYLRRLFLFRHMDFEFALWEILYLFISPQKVYRNFHYRKRNSYIPIIKHSSRKSPQDTCLILSHLETHGHWSRDDPAYLVLLSIAFLGSSLGFALLLHFGLFSTLKFLVWVALVDLLAVAFIVASLFHLLAEKVLKSGLSHGDAVEWAYSFDVHLNGLLPIVIILHLLQLPLLYPVILNDWFISRLIGNTFWLVGFIYYFYITFLGYSMLPFLHRTQLLLYPMTAIILCYFISLVAGWNFSQYLCDFYTYRVA